MTPGQAKFALTGFLLVMVGVSFNAIFLQTKPIATARAHERPTPQTGPERARAAAGAGDSARSAPGAAGTVAQPLRIAVAEGRHALHRDRRRIVEARLLALVGRQQQHR